MKYIFRCKECKRKEEVDENTFKKFISINWHNFLAASIREKALGAILQFNHGCPFCKQKGRSKADVILLKEAKSSSIRTG
jgi:hypothetical protein